MEPCKVLGPEDLREGADREQEVATFGRDPLLLRGVQRPAGDDAVDMEVQTTTVTIP